jgi:hypothetical protein
MAKSLELNTMGMSSLENHNNLTMEAQQYRSMGFISATLVSSSNKKKGNIELRHSNSNQRVYVFPEWNSMNEVKERYLEIIGTKRASKENLYLSRLNK